MIDEITTDLFEGDFPPICYGQTLEEVEATIQQVVERVFRDDDNIIRSCVNGRTMKPMRVEDVKDRPYGIDTHAENSDIPREFKPIWINYENAGGATASYLEALCVKWLATGDTRIRELACRTQQAIVTLWENASKIEHPLGGGGKGWLPKPYAGIRNLTGMHECSIDEYVDVTIGLYTYYRTIASEGEKRKIEEIIISFADWWYDHDYCGVYFGRAIYWKRLEWHSMAVAAFLYINALAYSFSPCRKFQEGFAIWLERKNALFNTEVLKGVSSTLISLEHLISLRPDLTSFWLNAASKQTQCFVECVEQGFWTSDKGLSEGHWNCISTYGSGTNFFAAAHRLWPQAGYDRLACRGLEVCRRREHFYHVRRGVRLADMPTTLRGDDYRDMFHYGPHTSWLSTYWHLILEKSIKK